MMVRYERQVESKSFKYLHLGECFITVNATPMNDVFMRVPANKDDETKRQRNAIRLRDGETAYIPFEEQCIVVEPKEEIVFIDKKEE